LSLIGQIRFYAKRSGQEIDFIIDEKQAVEVKETPTKYDLKVLKKRAMSIGLEQYYIIGKNQPASDFSEFVWGGAIH